jgi:molybdopterin converting factor small subunit
MAKILIPQSLRKFARNSREFPTSARSLKDAVDELIQHFPNLKAMFYEEEGHFGRFVKFYTDSKEIEQPYTSPIGDDAVIYIITPIAGG